MTTMPFGITLMTPPPPGYRWDNSGWLAHEPARRTCRDADRAADEQIQMLIDENLRLRRLLDEIEGAA